MHSYTHICNMAQNKKILGKSYMSINTGLFKSSMVYLCIYAMKYYAAIKKE